MKAIITCAGYASRLWPLTKDTPKPLLTVKDRPIATHIISKIAQIPAVDAVYVVANARFYDSFVKWQKSESFKVPVKILNDSTTTNDNRLGQVGDIQFVINSEKIDDDIIVVAGDNLFNFSLFPAWKQFCNSGNIVNALWESKSYRAAKESGSVVLNEVDNSFSEFMEKAQNPKTTLLSLGIYFFPKNKLLLFHKYLHEGNNADKMGYFLTWLMQNEKIYGHIYNEKWFDIGWIESLEQARKEFAE